MSSVCNLLYVLLQERRASRTVSRRASQTPSWRCGRQGSRCGCWLVTSRRQLSTSAMPAGSWRRRTWWLTWAAKTRWGGRCRPHWRLTWLIQSYFSCWCEMINVSDAFLTIRLQLELVLVNQTWTKKCDGKHIIIWWFCLLSASQQRVQFLVLYDVWLLLVNLPVILSFNWLIVWSLKPQKTVKNYFFFFFCSFQNTKHIQFMSVRFSHCKSWNCQNS